jgi:hypothetical protein
MRIHDKSAVECGSGKYAQEHLKGDNNVKQMVVAGSKGSFCVAQQSVEGHSLVGDVVITVEDEFALRGRFETHAKDETFAPRS